MDQVTQFWNEEEKGFSCTNCTNHLPRKISPGLLYSLVLMWLSVLCRRARRCRLCRKVSANAHKPAVQMHLWCGQCPIPPTPSRARDLHQEAGQDGAVSPASPGSAGRKSGEAEAASSVPPFPPRTPAARIRGILQYPPASGQKPSLGPCCWQPFRRGRMEMATLTPCIRSL